MLLRYVGIPGICPWFELMYVTIVVLGTLKHLQGRSSMSLNFKLKTRSSFSIPCLAFACYMRLDGNIIRSRQRTDCGRELTFLPLIYYHLLFFTLTGQLSFSCLKTASSLEKAFPQKAQRHASTGSSPSRVRCTLAKCRSMSVMRVNVA